MYAKKRTMKRRGYMQARQWWAGLLYICTTTCIFTPGAGRAMSRFCPHEAPPVQLKVQEGDVEAKPQGNTLLWFSHGGLASRQMPQGLSVRVRLLLIGPGAGMRVACASLPRFGALRRDNTPTPECLSICSISGTELLLELYPSLVP